MTWREWWAGVQVPGEALWGSEDKGYPPPSPEMQEVDARTRQVCRHYLRATARAYAMVGWCVAMALVSLGGSSLGALVFHLGLLGLWVWFHDRDAKRAQIALGKWEQVLRLQGREQAMARITTDLDALGLLRAETRELLRLKRPQWLCQSREGEADGSSRCE